MTAKPGLGRQESQPEVVLRRQLPRFNSKRISNVGNEDPQPAVVPETAHTVVDVQNDLLSSADSLMAKGLHAMNETLAEAVEEALGMPLPSMDVRFENLTVTATVSEFITTNPDAIQAPTLLTPAKRVIGRLCGRQRVVQKPILRGISGAFRSGRLTLVLGPPGSGKSALLKILGGRFPSSRSVQVSGEVSYNNLSRESIRDRLPRYVSYVDEQDAHYARMTVQETLQFAYACCAGKELPEYVSKPLAAAGPEALEHLTAHHRHAPKLVLKRVDLEGSKDRLVGDAIVPGVTASEKKRVTLGEMAFGLKHVHLLDGLSTNLDSHGTYEIIDSLKSMAKHFHRTVVVSLPQVTPEVLDLFDDIFLLHEGSVLYHGPREGALPYFASLGYECPPRKDVVDFLLEIGSDNQAPYRQSNAVTVALPPRTVAEFATTFQDSALFQATQEFLATPYDQSRDLHVPSPDVMPPFRLSFSEDLGLLLRRQWLLTVRNKAFLIARTVMVVIMGALYGTSFWQLQDNNPQLVLGLLFSCTMFLSLGQAAQIPVFMASRQVFYKQRGANFFRTSSYVFASCITQLPYALFETVLYGSFLYWMGGYVAHAGHFLVFLLTLFLCQVCFTAFFFLLAAMAPSPVVAQPAMAVSILLFTLFGGFLVTKSNIPDYFIWIYWINPIAWCIRALSVNQFSASKYAVCEYKGLNYCTTYGVKNMAQFSLASFDLEDDKKWIYYTWTVFAVSYIVLSIVSYFWLEYIRYESPATTQQIASFEESKDGIPIPGGKDMDVYVLQATTPIAAVDVIPPGQSLDDDSALAIPQDGCKGFVPVTLAFRDIWYSVPVPGAPKNSDEEIDLLRGVSGFALPGTLTAFMGPHGAGKTTLLDVIAGRKALGRVRGEIFMNGFPARELAMRRSAGYCEQSDLHADSATIREAMLFSAILRQDALIPAAEKRAFVEECIDLLALRPVANRIIRGSSPSLLKRVTIGVELAASPGLLFVDEPTTGMDVLAAKAIMQVLRQVADTGRTVVCSLHEPSTEVFSLVDSVLLLQRGGQMAYFGEIGQDATRVIEYFEEVPGVKPLKAGHNPASWMLESVTGEAVRRAQHRRRSTVTKETANTVDFAAYFETSDKCRIMEEDLDQDGVTRPSSVLPEIQFEKKRAASSWTQFSVVTMRLIRMYWRTPSYNITRFMLSIILALLFGLSYQGTNYTSARGISAGIGMIFLSSIFFGLISFNIVLPVAAAERAVFYRERAKETYNALWYYLATPVVEIPYVFLSALVYTAILFPLAGFEGQHEFLMYWFVTSIHVLMQIYMGQCLVYALPSVQAASGLGALLSSIFLLFAGFNPPTSKIPSAYMWLHYASPPSYTIAALAGVLFSDCETPGGSKLGCQVVKNPSAKFMGASVKIYVEAVFKMKHDLIWTNIAILIVLCFMFRGLALLALRYVNHQKK
ncbi:hypothetical protein Poli38472_013015 [Pythium oligandrum]|uniref:ABC transporter domain-containing protein n=1 Tax=Pythium oligandrum TaxID=41045 RepID=A0A8K1FN81_PYTOL|nr:hypothetical protein Poli38472_013015 [Pythium oligandrum]|eukprot:TMW64393.1 hypothetical protein Poli38472_013015 [Pythium oligandrum]